jgi:hypothetical protein
VVIGVPNDAAEAVAPTRGDIASWTGLAAVPSGLLLAVTTHITTDIAAVPLLWVFPLALYLLTFVIAFQSRPLIPHRTVVKIFPAAAVVLAAFMVLAPVTWVVGLILVHTGTFFIIALLCNGELARRRPAPCFLTSFYMWISVGGMVGGVATSLAAPHVFSWVAEYPLLIVFAVLCLPGVTQSAKSLRQYVPIAGFGLLALILAGLNALDTKVDGMAVSVLGGMTLGLSVYFWRKPLPFAAALAFFFFVNYSSFGHYKQNFSVRNFFGVLTAAETPDGRFRILWHGTIGQGAQRIRDDNGHPLAGRPELISEFFDGAGLAQTVDAVRARVGGPIRYAVIGLGTGAMSCRAHLGDSVTYYEIDPDVIRVARDPRLFSFISECGPDTRIVQGDARLTLRDTPDRSYDLILIDAFLGAAIPTHLLTREAMELYLRKLDPNGIVAVHVSNRNLELASVVAGIAEANGAITRVYKGGDVKDDPQKFHWVPNVAAVARKEEDFGMLSKSRYWPIRQRDPAQLVWSDDYSNIVGALIRKLRDKHEL